VDVASIHHVAILAPRHVGRELCRPEARCTADGSRLTQIGQDELNALLIKEQQHGHDVKRARPNSSKAPALVASPPQYVLTGRPLSTHWCTVPTCTAAAVNDGPV
jgi:hypothetical protein